MMNQHNYIGIMRINQVYEQPCLPCMNETHRNPTSLYQKKGARKGDWNHLHSNYATTSWCFHKVVGNYQVQKVTNRHTHVWFRANLLT